MHAAIIIATLLAAEPDAGVPDRVVSFAVPDMAMVESATACETIYTDADGGWNCLDVRAEPLGKGWWISPSKMTRIATKITDLENDVARLKPQQPLERIPPPAPALLPDQFKDNLMWLLLGAAVGGAATTYIFLNSGLVGAPAR